MKVSIIGTGFVGLVTGACLAEKGCEVICVDLDPAKVDLINRGRPPIFERGLEELLHKHAGKRLRATLDTREAVLSTEITLIAVGTPFDGQHIDLSYVLEAARGIGEVLKDKKEYHVVVVKSTVVPGTTDDSVKRILEQSSGKRAGRDFGLGMNPEFLTEGEAVSDTMDPDRIVLGGIDARSQDAQERLYSGFPDVPRLRTNNATAEMIKYASNAMLATLISFSNELANLGAQLGGIDTVDVMRGLHMSRYLSPVANGVPVVAPITSFLMAGCGFGGSCLPKDVSALVAHGNAVGVPMAVLKGALAVNAGQPAQIFQLLGKHFDALRGVPVAVLGLAFRPDTNDMRESPAIPIIDRLLAEGAAVSAYDPRATDEARHIFRDRIRLCDSMDSALDGARAVILVTRWKEFEGAPALIAGRDPQPVLIDGRRMLDKDSVKSYEGIGL